MAHRRYRFPRRKEVLFCDPAGDGDAFPAAPLNISPESRELFYVLNEFLSVRTPAQNIVGSKTPVNAYLRFNIAKILNIPVLIGVAKDKVKRAFKGRDKLVGITETGVDIGSNTCLLEVFQCDLMPLLVDFDGGNSATRFCRGPCQPYR
jgi:hypothetical protein